MPYWLHELALISHLVPLIDTGHFSLWPSDNEYFRYIGTAQSEIHPLPWIDRHIEFKRLHYPSTPTSHITLESLGLVKVFSLDVYCFLRIRKHLEHDLIGRVRAYLSLLNLELVEGLEVYRRDLNSQSNG